MKQNRLTCHVTSGLIVPALLLLLAASLAAEETIDGPSLLEKMKASDAKYHSGFSASGTIVYPEKEFTSHFRFTCADGRYALEREGEPLTELELWAGTPSRNTRELYDGRPGKNPSYVFIIHQIIWTAGRDFSDYLDSITDVAPADKPGCVSVTAPGWITDKDKGQWKLVVDCDADYMVRDAEFTRARDADPFFAIHNEGFNLRGLSCYPSKGTFGNWPGRGRKPMVITIDASLRRPDRELLESARAPLLENWSR